MPTRKEKGEKTMSIFKQDYEKYVAITERYQVADEETKAICRRDMRELSVSIAAKGEMYEQVFSLYKDAQERGNAYIDLSEVNREDSVEPLVKAFRELGIQKFTFSSQWTDAVEIAWLFQKAGCKLEGLVEINGKHKNFVTGIYQKAHGYLFSC